MSRKSVLGAVAAGATGAAAGLWVSSQLARLRETVSVECSIQIARLSEEVFSSFAQVVRMPQYVRSLVSVASCEDTSVWIAEIEGRRYQWDVEIVQVVPKQVIGWKSCHGPKHSGRISFFSLGEETLVHVEMNYVPVVNLAQLFDRPSLLSVGDAIETALCDIRAVLEGSHSRLATFPSKAVYKTAREQGTGTYGPSSGISNPARAAVLASEEFDRSPKGE